MEVQFPDSPLYEIWGRPFRSEVTIDGLELLEGKIPQGLNGTWYRAGPDRQYPTLTDHDVFIDGEGMLYQFRFDAGHVSYKSRWVRNERFLLQERERRGLFGRYRNRYTNDPLVGDPTDTGTNTNCTSNTNVIFHAGKCLVLKEDALPYEIDPDTLETRATYDYDGQIKAKTMSAHPKIDLVNDRLLTFSYQARGDGTRDVVFYEIDGNGKVVDEIWFEAPFSGFVHDFAITPEFVVFPFFPVITDMEHVKAGGSFYEWHGEKEAIVAIVKRGATASDIRWFKGSNASASHMMNAFQDGTKVMLDLCLYEGNLFPFFPTPEGEFVEAVPPFLTRLTFDLAQNEGGYTKQRLAHVPCEMPRTDDRYQGLAYRYGWTNALIAPVDERGTGGESGIGAIDMLTGEFKVYGFGPRTAVHEQQFVPRAPDSPEGDGWILAIVNRLDKNHSDLAILDAKDLTKGPVALLGLPVRVRASFHGTWVPSETLKSGHYKQFVTV